MRGNKVIPLVGELFEALSPKYDAVCISRSKVPYQYCITGVKFEEGREHREVISGVRSFSLTAARFILIDSYAVCKVTVEDGRIPHKYLGLNQ